MRAGASVFERTRVTEIAPEQREWGPGLECKDFAGKVAGTRSFCRHQWIHGPGDARAEKEIIPIGAYIIVTEVLREPLAVELSPRNRMIYDSKNYLYYYRLTPDRRMLFGGRAAFFPESERSIRTSAEILRRGMIDVYPRLRDTKMEYVWGGTLDFAFDIMPHTGQIDGMYYSLGYAGHGVAMATYLGSKMAEMIGGAREVDNPFVRIRFPGAPLGLYNGKPWFLPFAGAWYKFLDWVT